jgi:ubiquinone/menaquinone biosynthesis C-methylase UbiE
MQRSSRVDYDVIAELYDSTPHREKSADPELIAFLAWRGPTASVTLLDIACGTGNQQIANRGLAPDAKFVGLDGSLGMLRQARRKMLDIAWVHGDSAALPFASTSIDFISCQYAFHHFRDKAGMLREAFRVLRRGGRFALYDMCPQESEDWLYYAYFPEAKTRDFADFWPPDAIVSEMTATGFTGVEVERRHVHRRARPGGAAVGSAVPRAELTTAVTIGRSVSGRPAAYRTRPRRSADAQGAHRPSVRHYGARGQTVGSRR